MSKISNSMAASVLESMLYEHNCNSAFIDFDSDDDDEIEKKETWEMRKQALETAIQTLKNTK